MKNSKKILALLLITYSGLSFATNEKDSLMHNQLKSKNQEIMINTDLNDLSKKISLTEIMQKAKERKELKESNEKQDSKIENKSKLQ